MKAIPTAALYVESIGISSGGAFRVSYHSWPSRRVMQSSRKLEICSPPRSAAKWACFYTLPIRPPVLGLFPPLRSSMRKRDVSHSSAHPLTFITGDAVPAFLSQKRRRRVCQVVATCRRVERKIARARGFIFDCGLLICLG